MKLIFTSSNAWISRAIRAITRSEVSHVAIQLELHGIPVYLHADMGGVQISPAHRFFAGRVLRHAFRLEPVPLHGAVISIGDSYDYVGIVGHFFRAVLAWLGYSWKRPLQSPHALVCSEFVSRLPLEIFAALDPENTTPQDLLVLCRQHPTVLMPEILS